MKTLTGDISTERIEQWRREGGKALGIVCCHAPFELLHAAGVLPVRLRSTGCKSCADAVACTGESNCGFVTSILQYLIDGVYDLDGLVASNGCGDAPAVFSNWKTITNASGREQFLYEIFAPHMVNEASYSYFASGLDELREGLEQFTGRTITNDALRRSVDIYNEARRLVKQVYDLHKAEHPVVGGAETLKLTLAATQMPIEEYIELLKAFLAEAETRAPITNFSKRVMIAGSALDDPEYIKAIEDCGLLVVADLNSFGIRFLRDELPYDENNVAASIARYYLTRSSCPRMMDGSDDIHEYILNAAQEYRVDGVIIERMKHCGKWDVETVLLENVFKEANIPSLSIDRDVILTAQGQLTLRVEAFREMLESR